MSLGQDDTVYREHRHVQLPLANRPPSSPSRFDLKTRVARPPSQSAYHAHFEPPPTSVPSRTSLFEIVHRPPSQNKIRPHRISTAPVSISKSSSFNQQPQSSLEQKPRPRTTSALIRQPPQTYEVKRGNKIYKVVVGYVSPFTSPLQRQELHLKTDGQIDGVMEQIKQQQIQQRASQPHVWLGLK